MSGKYFLDTNVLVYCFHWDDRAKQRRATELVGEALESGGGVISTQVIQEFITVATKKFAKPLTTKEAKDYLDEVLGPLCDVYPNVLLFKEALGIKEETQFSFYDCLIVAAALQANCDTLYSEDMQDGRTIGGVTIRNPFAGAAAKS